LLLGTVLTPASPQCADAPGNARCTPTAQRWQRCRRLFHRLDGYAHLLFVVGGDHPLGSMSALINLWDQSPNKPDQNRLWRFELGILRLSSSLKLGTCASTGGGTTLIAASRVVVAWRAATIGRAVCRTPTNAEITLRCL
jgi:hypothetical protein